MVKTNKRSFSRISQENGARVVITQSDKKRTPIFLIDNVDENGISHILASERRIINRFMINDDDETDIPVIPFSDMIFMINRYKIECWIKNKCPGIVAKAKRKRLKKISSS